MRPPERNPFVLDCFGAEEKPPLRWRAFHDVLHSRGCGVLFFAGPEWAVHLYLGKWMIGIERTREED